MKLSSVKGLEVYYFHDQISSLGPVLQGGMANMAIIRCHKQRSQRYKHSIEQQDSKKLWDRMAKLDMILEGV